MMDVTDESSNGPLENNNQSEVAIDWSDTSSQKRKPLMLVDLESEDDVEMEKYVLDRRGDLASNESGTSDSDPDTSSSSDEEKKNIQKKPASSRKMSPESSSDSSSDEEKENIQKKPASSRKMSSESSSDSSSDEEEEKVKKKPTSSGKMSTGSSSDSSTDEEVKITEMSVLSKTEKNCCDEDKATSSRLNEQAFCTGHLANNAEDAEEMTPHRQLKEGTNTFEMKIEDSAWSAPQISLVSYDSTSEEEDDEEEDEEEVEVEGKEELSFHPSNVIPKIAPIKVPGELTVEDLPPIDLLSLEVSEDTELRLIGRVSSIVDSLVVIQCLPGAPGLDDDSMLFREDRKSIGKVFELFGPVVAPFCSVRFNSAEEAKDAGVKVGMAVLFAPQRADLSRIVLPARLDTKGSDASWKNDHEPPPHFLDYSDDETERREKRKARGRPTDDPAEEQAEPSDGTTRPCAAPKRKERRTKRENPSWQGPPSGFWRPPLPSHQQQRWPLPPMDLSVPPPGWTGVPVPPVPVGVPSGHQPGNSTGNQTSNPSGHQPGNSTGNQTSNPSGHLRNSTGNQTSNPSGHLRNSTGNQSSNPSGHLRNSTGNQTSNPSGHLRNSTGNQSSNLSGHGIESTNDCAPSPSTSQNNAASVGPGFDHYFDHYYKYYQQYYQQYYQSQPPKS